MIGRFCFWTNTHQPPNNINLKLFSFWEMSLFNICEIFIIKYISIFIRKLFLRIFFFKKIAACIEGKDIMLHHSFKSVLHSLWLVAKYTFFLKIYIFIWYNSIDLCMQTEFIVCYMIKMLSTKLH